MLKGNDIFQYDVTVKGKKFWGTIKPLVQPPIFVSEQGMRIPVFCWKGKISLILWTLNHNQPLADYFTIKKQISEIRRGKRKTHSPKKHTIGAIYATRWIFGIWIKLLATKRKREKNQERNTFTLDSYFFPCLTEIYNVIT